MELWQVRASRVAYWQIMYAVARALTLLQITYRTQTRFCILQE
jgi:hypothetical protein